MQMLCANPVRERLDACGLVIGPKYSQGLVLVCWVYVMMVADDPVDCRPCGAVSHGSSNDLNSVVEAWLGGNVSATGFLPATSQASTT